ncbi:MAG: DUF1501 domain-containing protein [Myxococcota bacterium]
MLRTAAASGLGLFVPQLLRAATATSDKRFVVVFAYGGWDTTRVFTDGFDNPAVDMEPAADRLRVGNLSLVDGPGRPSVRAFFERHHADVAVLEGLLVPSVAHETCTQMMMTGGTRGTPDWAALLAGVAADRYVLPNLVIDGPSFPSQFGMAVARSGLNGQLDGLIDGSRLSYNDEPLPLPSRSVQGAVDRYVARRAAAAQQAAVSEAERLQLQKFAEAHRRAVDLEDARYATTFGASNGFQGKLGVAVEAIATGLSRSVSLSFGSGAWDTHSDNDARQAPLWEELFAGLLELREQLDTTTGTSGRPLSEEVVVLVLSEMNRTPGLNGDNGKDHWPYTSLMTWGPGIRGDRQVGGYDANFQGRGIDLATGDLADGGVVPTTSHLGATLLAANDLDPAEWLPGYPPIAALVE